jgi:phage gp36-like protein
MSQYCSIADLLNRIDRKILIDYSNDDSSNATSINATTIIGMIETASAIMDGYLRAAGYVLPIALPIPRDLVACCVKLTIYDLFDRKKRVNDLVRVNYTDSMEYLKNIQARESMLSVDASEPTTQNPTVVNIDGDKFSSDKMGRYM